jgi:hypothetical protein
MTSSDHHQEVLKQARISLRKGWQPVPIPEGRKGPRIKDWPTLRLTKCDLEEAFGKTDNIGAILGEASGGLVDIDLDSPEAIAVARSFLPPTGRIHGRRTKLFSHQFYRCAPVPSPKQFAGIDGTMLLELRSNGQQTLIPPSRHPNGEQFVWHAAQDPGDVEADHLIEAVRRTAACALLARHWPERGQRHEASKALAGMLLRAGWTQDDCVKFLTEAARASGRDEEWESRKGDVFTTFKRISSGKPITGIPRLVEILGDQLIKKVTEWLEIPGTTIEVLPSSVPLALVQWPAPLARQALQGLPGEIVSLIEPQSEADPAALLIQAVVCFGNAVGRTPFFKVSSDRHSTNLYAVLVGETAKARKGLSWGSIRDLYERAAPDWARNCVQSGLSTGEGLIWAVRDPIFRQESTTESDDSEDSGPVLVDAGVTDKRLLALEPEYAQPLKLMTREGNILSTVIRQCWDDGNVRTLTKTSPGRASGAHVSIIGHITLEEIRKHLTETEQANGFANRYLFFCVRRSKLLPEGGYVPEEGLDEIASQLKKALMQAQNVKEVRRSDQARKLWREIYTELSQGKPGLLGSVTSRAEAQVMRLAMVYALMNCSATIRREHLEAALAVWTYAATSARFIFGNKLGDSLADEVLAALRMSTTGMTRTRISSFFQRHRSSGEITRALEALLRHGLATFQMESTDGRPEERWFAQGASARKAKEE